MFLLDAFLLLVIVASLKAENKIDIGAHAVRTACHRLA
jgi:hypothetical protein